MKNNKPSEYFELYGEPFSTEDFPNLYKMFCANKTHTEETIKSIADAWHQGDIISAAQALESDLEHK